MTTDPGLSPSSPVTSYHVHSRWSDGVAIVPDIVAQAHSLGLDEVGISDHFVLHPDTPDIEWSMRSEELPRYVSEVLAFAAQSQDISVRLGIEADYIPETIDTLKEALALHPFDYVIGSVHFMDGFPIDEHRRYWDSLSADQVNQTWLGYYTRIVDMAASGAFDIVGHLDLPKKFGHAPTADMTAAVNAALDAIARADMAMEINTSGWSLPANEAYPAPWIVRAARSRDIPIVITADAHTPKYLTRNFDMARRLARASGYTQLALFERRVRRLQDM